MSTKTIDQRIAALEAELNELKADIGQKTEFNICVQALASEAASGKASGSIIERTGLPRAAYAERAVMRTTYKAFSPSLGVVTLEVEK